MGVIIVIVSISSVDGAVVVPAGVVLFSTLLVGSAVLLSVLGFAVDGLAVVPIVPCVALRSVGVIIVVVSMSSVAGDMVVPAKVVLFSNLLTGSAVLWSVLGLVVDGLAVVPVVPCVVLRSVGVMIVVVSMSSVAGAVVVPTRVVLFSTRLVGSAVLLSVLGLVVDGLAVVTVVPCVVLRSVGVMIVVVSMSSVAGAVVVPTRVVLFSTRLVGSAVLLSVLGLVVDDLAVVTVVP